MQDVDVNKVIAEVQDTHGPLVDVYLAQEKTERGWQFRLLLRAPGSVRPDGEESDFIASGYPTVALDLLYEELTRSAGRNKMSLAGFDMQESRS